jgi:hypothetical protein
MTALPEVPMRRALLVLLSCGALHAAAPTPARADPGETPVLDALDALRARESELLAVVAARDPEKHAALLRLRDTDRRAYWMRLGMVARMLDGDLPPPPPPALRAAMAELEALRARYPDGTDGLSTADARALRAELTALATRIFDLKQAERRDRIARLREALAALEADVAARDKDRKARIEAWVDQFLSGPPDL